MREEMSETVMMPTHCKIQKILYKQEVVQSIFNIYINQYLGE